MNVSVGGQAVATSKRHTQAYDRGMGGGKRLPCFLNVSGSLDVDRSGNQNPFGKLGGCYPKFSRQGIRQAGRGFQAKGPLVENDQGAKPA